MGYITLNGHLNFAEHHPKFVMVSNSFSSTEEKISFRQI